ncbi:MAG: hypothetical protein MR691_00180 [Clostridium sp.]|nr:hypothetical protein [Clostridium sp.]
MSYIISSLIIIILSSALSCIINKKFEEVVPFITFSIIFILYISGIMGKLIYGNIFIIILASISFISIFYHIKKYNSSVLKNIFTPGFIFFISMYILFFIVHKNRLFTYWDEFTHWGLVVKNMFNLDALGSIEASTDACKGYPPAISLFEYFISSFSKEFEEANCYRAYSIFLIILLLPIFKNFNWKNPIQILLTSIICFILPTVFITNCYSSIYVDCILGIIFSYIIFIYFSETFNTFTFINIGLACGILTLAKASGIGLAIIAYLIILIDLFIIKKISLTYTTNKKNIKKILLSIPFLFILFSKFSWNIYLKLSKANVAWDTSNITFDNIKNLFNGNIEPYQKICLKNFFNTFINFNNTLNSGGTIYLIWILVTIISFKIISKFIIKKKNEILRMKYLFIGLIVGLIIYSISLLILYLFTYSEYEASNVASINRYLNTYFTAILSTIILLVIYFLIKYNNKYTTKIFICIIIFLLCASNYHELLNVTLLYKSSINKTIAERKSYSNINKYHLDYTKDRVFLFSSLDNKFDYWVLRYNIVPVKTNDSYEFSFSSNDNIENTIINENYNYFYVYELNYINKNNVSNFLKKHNLEEKSLYKIEKSSNSLKFIKQ